jgi:hypothetical protein
VAIEQISGLGCLIRSPVRSPVDTLTAPSPLSPAKRGLGILAAALLLLIVGAAGYLCWEPAEKGAASPFTLTAGAAPSAGSSVPDHSGTPNAATTSAVTAPMFCDAEWIHVNGKLEQARLHHEQMLFQQLMCSQEYEPEAHRAIVAQQTERVEKLNRLGDDQLIDALKLLGVQEPTHPAVTALQQAREKEASLLRAGVAPDHPELKSAQGSVRAHLQTVRNVLESFRRTQQKGLEVEKAVLEAAGAGPGAWQTARVQARQSSFERARAELDEAEKNVRAAEAIRGPANHIRDWRQTPAR